MEVQRRYRRTRAVIREHVCPANRELAVCRPCPCVPRVPSLMYPSPMRSQITAQLALDQLSLPVGAGNSVLRSVRCSCQLQRSERLGSAQVAGRRQDVVLSFLYWSLRRLLELVLLRGRSEREKEIEILLLRHQLRALERQIARPQLTQADRALLAAFSRVLPQPAWRRSAFVTPATL